jgi:hypothetical protein
MYLQWRFYIFYSVKHSLFYKQFRSTNSVLPTTISPGNFFLRTRFILNKWFNCSDKFLLDYKQHLHIWYLDTKLCFLFLVVFLLSFFFFLFFLAVLSNYLHKWISFIASTVCFISWSCLWNLFSDSRSAGFNR